MRECLLEDGFRNDDFFLPPNATHVSKVSSRAVSSLSYTRYAINEERDLIMHAMPPRSDSHLTYTSHLCYLTMAMFNEGYREKTADSEECVLLIYGFV